MRKEKAHLRRRTLTPTQRTAALPQTSQVKEKFPSTPPGTRRSTKEQANAGAAAQMSKDHHRNLQTCSTRLRNSGGSERASNRTRDLMNLHRTIALRLLRPTQSTDIENSGYRSSFRRLATLKAIPSLRATLGRAVPSAWRERGDQYGVHCELNSSKQRQGRWRGL